MFWNISHDFVLGVLASMAASIIGPYDMIGFSVAAIFAFVGIVRWHRARVKEGKRGMDSWYFIALSGMVAVGAIGATAYGVGLRTATKVAAETSAAPPLAWATNSTTTAVPSVSTAAIDIPKKIEAIDELLDILDKDWDPWMNLCQGLSTGGWRNQIIGKKIKELRDSIYKMSSDYTLMSRKIDALNKQNEKFPDIFALTTRPYAENFKPKLDSFVKVFGSLSDPMGNALDQVTLENVFEKYATDLYEQTQKANDWRTLTARSALEIRKSLSR
jgi:hypothetical protein